MANAEAVAEHLDLSRQRVNELVRKRVLPRKGPEGWDLQECLFSYLRHLRREVLVQRLGREAVEHLTTDGVLR